MLYGLHSVDRTHRTFRSPKKRKRRTPRSSYLDTTHICSKPTASSGVWRKAVLEPSKPRALARGQASVIRYGIGGVPPRPSVWPPASAAPQRSPCGHILGAAQLSSVTKESTPMPLVQGLRVGPRSEQPMHSPPRQAVHHGIEIHHNQLSFQSLQDGNVQLLADTAEASQANCDESYRG